MPCSDCSRTSFALKKLTECNLLSRIRLNRAPVASERTELSELISQAEKDLVGYEETIAWLQEKIVALKNEQKGLSRQVRFAKSLMAPIRQLPPELLRQIFIAHGVQSILNTNRMASCVIPGFKIASICSHWRFVAMDTTALWNDISVVITDGNESDSLLPLIEQLLALLQKSLLSISLQVYPRMRRQPKGTISMLVLLCAQSNPWQCLGGALSCGHHRQGIQPIIDTLASIRGHLDNLHTFEFSGPFEYCSRLVEGAPKLHTLSICSDFNDRSITIPWNQIANLTVTASHALKVAESLQKMPNLLSLDLIHFRHTIEDEVRQHHSNLKSLKIRVDDDEDEEGMEKLFESFTLPQLQSLYIEVKSVYLTSQNNRTWSSLNLPSLISRSSALITSFTLYEIWIPASNLISLLRIMPALTSLFLSESGDPDVYPMIDDQLLLSMHMHHHQDQQPILTHLTSLNLDASPQASFSISTFVDMIHSRWKPAYLDDVACIRSVRLFAWDFTIVPKTVQSLMVLRKRGLDVTIEDENGVALGMNLQNDFVHFGKLFMLPLCD